MNMNMGKLKPNGFSLQPANLDLCLEKLECV